jgi:hypothetical protein
MKKAFWAKRIAGFIVIGVAAVALFTYLVMGLWNAILVPVLAVNKITFWQAAGILVLSKILFGGFKGRGGWGGHGRQWKHDLRERWAGMSDDEKLKMKQEWKQRCNYWKGGRFESSNAGFTGSENFEPKQ